MVEGRPTLESVETEVGDIKAEDMFGGAASKVSAEARRCCYV